MNRYLASRVLIIIALALVGVLGSISAADAATRYTPVRSGATLNYDDDEMNTYARVYTQVKRNRDGTVTEKYGFYPDPHYNKTLFCGFGSNIQSIYVNPRSVLGYDAPGVHFECKDQKTSRAYRRHTFRPHGTDRKFNAYVRAYKRYVGDPSGYTRVRYARR